MGYEIFFEKQKRQLLKHPRCGDLCPHSSAAAWSVPMYGNSLQMTCKEIYDEVAPIIYGRYMLNFFCTCSMLNFLQNSSIIVKQSIVEVSFLWVGSERERAILQLDSLRSLSKLTVRIHGDTKAQMSAREVLARHYFSSRRSKLGLIDASGGEELMNLKGLKEVQVEDARPRRSAFRTQERKELETFLRFMCRRPRITKAPVSIPMYLCVS